MTRLTEAERAALIETAEALADVARVATLKHFRAPGLSAETKESDRFDPVTVADREAEAVMRALLARAARRTACWAKRWARPPGPAA